MAQSSVTIVGRPGGSAWASNTFINLAPAATPATMAGKSVAGVPQNWEQVSPSILQQVPATERIPPVSGRAIPGQTKGPAGEASPMTPEATSLDTASVRAEAPAQEPSTAQEAAQGLAEQSPNVTGFPTPRPPGMLMSSYIRTQETKAPTPPASRTMGEYLRYANQGATRNLELAPKLTSAMSFLDEMGVTMEVFSGGQPKKGSGLPRVGSTRHDLGNAADVFFYKDGRKLDWAKPDDVPLFQEIVRKAKSRGVTGFGAGPGYMRPGSMHLGFGSAAAWGRGGVSATAPKWLTDALRDTND